MNTTPPKLTQQAAERLISELERLFAAFCNEHAEIEALSIKGCLTPCETIIKGADLIKHYANVMGLLVVDTISHQENLLDK